jgi:phage terminase large subunit-like protein
MGIASKMNTRQTITSKLNTHGISISGNQLEAVIFAYKKKYSNKYKGIDLLFDMLDEESEFLKFKDFIEEKMKGCQAEEHFTIITCFARDCKCEKKETGCSQPQN